MNRTSLALDTDEFNTDCNNATVENRGPLRVTPINILPDQYSASGIKRRYSDENADQDAEYRKSVLRQMFPIGNKSSSAPAHTIEAPCTPRATATTTTTATTTEKNPDEIAIDMDEDKSTDLISNKKRNNSNGTKTTISQHPLADSNGKQQQRSMDYLRNPLPRTQPYPVATSYICRGPTLPGKFNPKAAKELGITPGPIFGNCHSIFISKKKRKKKKRRKYA